ncbi:hypothetical protein DMENIID0001_054690 [Sergentomyia squamirostris]
MLLDIHLKLRKYIFWYFNIIEMQCIPAVGYSMIDKGKALIFPLLLSASVFCNAWHLSYQVDSLNNLLDISININFAIGGLQAIITNGIVNFILKEKHLIVLKYFDKIVQSKEELLIEAREQKLKGSLEFVEGLANISFGCILTLTGAGLFQTNYVSPLFYTIPGISESSFLFRPANIIIQIFFSYLICYGVITSDLQSAIYLFYFHGEFSSIKVVTERLGEKRNLISRESGKILKTVYEAHLEVLSGFSDLSVILWHFYSHKMLAACLYLCSALFAYTKSNSLVTAVVFVLSVLLQLFILCLPAQVIEDSSEEFRKTLYNKVLWYEMSPENQKQFSMIFMGSQRGIEAKTFGVGKISVYTFLQIVKAAFSYAAFVYTVLL